MKSRPAGLVLAKRILPTPKFTFAYLLGSLNGSQEACPGHPQFNLLTLSQLLGRDGAPQISPRQWGHLSGVTLEEIEQFSPNLMVLCV